MENFLDTFLYAYTVTSQVVFPMLIFIIILLIIDLGKYSRLSEKISKILSNLSDSIDDSGFKKNTDEKVLCYVEDLNCVAKSVDKKSTKIFNSNEDLSEDMKRVFEFLKSIEQNELVTQKALLAIKKANIIEDWSLSIKLSDGERTMKGLKKINIEKFKFCKSCQ